MPPRLLDRQVELLEFLTGGAAAFGEGAPPAGLDAGRLRLEARLSHQKRMEKIELALPRTLARAVKADPEIVRRFAYACPPAEAGRVENARQFAAFLDDAPSLPGYLADLCAVELAVAEVLAAAGDGAAVDRPAAVRRNRAVKLLSLSHDVRTLFEDMAADGAPSARAMQVAVAVARGESYPQIYELPAAIIDLLRHLDDWAAVADLPGADALLADLSGMGLVDLRA